MALKDLSETTCVCVEEGYSDFDDDILKGDEDDSDEDTEEDDEY